MKLKAIVFGLVVLFASAVVCSAQSAHMGTWKLNEAQSKIPAGSAKNTDAASDSMALRAMQG